MMPSSSNFPFNDLPTEVQYLTFHHLKPLERALVLSTCQEWHQLIMGSQGYWRDLKVGKGGSFERMMEMLQAFTARSQSTMNNLIIDRLIKTEEELQKIFDVITLSSSTIRILQIRQRDKLDSLTRQYARSLPRLYILRCGSARSYEPLVESSVPISSENGLSYYQTHSLFDVQEDEIAWLSHLVSLRFFGTNLFRNIISILRRNASTLKSLNFTSVKGSEDQTFALDPLVFEMLSNLSLPSHPLSRPAFILPLASPNLTVLSGRISQLRSVVSPSVKLLTVYLEEESLEWVANQTGTFSRDVEGSLMQFSLVEILQIATFSEACPIQLKMILEALHWSNTEDKEPNLPQLKGLSVCHPDPTAEIGSLVELFVSRQEYRQKNGQDGEFKLDLSETEQKRFDEALRVFRGK